MWTLKQSSRFKKDYKRILNNPEKLKALDAVLSSLVNTGAVPSEYSPHSLSGNWAGNMECHIMGDFLLIWRDENENVIKLIRLGSHSELFKG